MLISVVEQEWFRSLMKQVEPRFQPVSRIAVSSKLGILYKEEKRSLLSDIAKLNVDKSSNLDFSSGHDTRRFMGCTVHYNTRRSLKVTCFFC